LRLFTLSDFRKGDDVIVHPGFKTEDAEKVFPKINIVKPYLRFTSFKMGRVRLLRCNVEKANDIHCSFRTIGIVVADGIKTGGYEACPRLPSP
jgi:hypothetical protein